MRLIDADAIIYEYERVFKTKFVKESVINKMPTVDAVPVVHGHWIFRDDGDVYEFYPCSVCSKCGEEWVLDAMDFEDFKFSAHFCPNCGAKMDEEADT